MLNGTRYSSAGGLRFASRLKWVHVFPPKTWNRSAKWTRRRRLFFRVGAATTPQVSFAVPFLPPTLRPAFSGRILKSNGITSINILWILLIVYPEETMESRGMAFSTSVLLLKKTQQKADFFDMDHKTRYLIFSGPIAVSVPRSTFVPPPHRGSTWPEIHILGRSRQRKTTLASFDRA